MPCRNIEYKKAVEDGITFNFLTNPVKFIGDEYLSKIEVVKMQLISVENDRPRPIVIENSNYLIDCNLVVLALSSDVDKTLTNELAIDKWNTIIVNEKMQTSIENVFAGGDCVSGPSLVVNAMKDGIKAAHSIDCYIKKR